VEGEPWLKQTKGMLPTKFSMKNIMLMAKAWDSFVVHTLESCGNALRFRLMRVVVVQAIMKGDEINVGRIIADDIKRIANEIEKTFSFGHC